MSLLGVELLFALLVTGFLLQKYIDCRRVHLIVTFSTFIGWYFSFIIIFVLPLDVAITLYNQCRLNENITRYQQEGNETVCQAPDGYVADSVLLNLWRVVYWTAQCLTWLILPIMQSYSQAGEFTATGKLWTAMVSNAVYYATYLVIFVFLLIYAALKGVSINFEHLKVILISGSNTWGLFLLVVLLGYGLVEVPRQIWRRSSREYRLHRTYFNLDKLSTDKNDAEETAYELYGEARNALNCLKHEHGLRDNAQVILSAFSPELVTRMNEARHSTNESTMANNIVYNEKYLVRLHKRVLEAVQAENRLKARWDLVVSKAFALESLDGDSSIWERSWIGRLLPSSVYRLWRLYLEPIFFKQLAVLFGGMTLMVIWSECTFFIVHPTLSLAAAFVQSAAAGHHYLYIKFGGIFLIAYLCMCAYYTVFRLKIFRYYHLDSNRMTDENSLLFSAILLCRLTPPLCLNFLGMIHLDSHITSSADRVETQFTKLMGHLDVLPIVAKGLNIYLPILITLLCLATWQQLGMRFLHWLGVEQFVENDEMTRDSIQAGRSLVALERNKSDRQMKRDRREQVWRETGTSRLPVEYSDRAPIMADEPDNPSNEGYGAPRHHHHPPPNMFDDL